MMKAASRRAAISIFLFAALLSAGTLRAQQPATVRRPLDKVELQGLLSASADASSLVELVKERGIDFVPTEDYLKQLQLAGATPSLIDAVREAGEKSAANSKQMKLRISVSEPTLVIVDADGAHVLNRILSPAGPETLVAHKYFDLTTADAAAVQLSMDGAPLKPLGASGELKTVHLTRETIKDLIAPKEAAPKKKEQPDVIAAPLGPLRVSAREQAAKALYHPEPKYPRVAKHSHLSGTVTLEVIIAKDGTVEEVKPLAGPDPLVKSAIEAVKQWRYAPTMVDGKNVEVMTEVKIDFKSSTR